MVRSRHPKTRFSRLQVLFFGFTAFASIILFRLFVLQVVNGGFYSALASGQYAFYEELFPERGDIFVQDFKDGEIYPAATNVYLGFVYADPRHVEDPEETAEDLRAILGMTEEEETLLIEKLSKEDDPYEPILRRVPEEKLQEIERMKDEGRLSGIAFVREAVRTYPEDGLGGHVFGFVGSNDDGHLSGRYGIEGHFDETLAGTLGYLESESDPAGRLIAVGESSYVPAVDGSDVVLTIDRTIQYTVCDLLHDAVLTHQADGGSVIVLDPSTGAVLAMCGDPDFDPDSFNTVENIDAFNNPAIFKEYESGSVMKAITMAAALDAGAVTPTSTYEDTGSVKIDEFEIKNSDEKAHGIQTMTQVLEESLNTGVIFAMREMGQDTFVDYIERFGFGTYTGIELDTEVPGDTSALDLPGEVYAATASYGHGITVTPLQIAAAYAALANGGALLQPYIVEEVVSAEGEVKETEPLLVRQVISEKTSRLVSAMLISVVENGHGRQAGVPGYYIAGKTGTAEVPRADGQGYYEDVTIGTFAGYGPVSDPRFVIVVRIDHPRNVTFAESTAAPLFGEIASFLLRYFEVPPER